MTIEEEIRAHAQDIEQLRMQLGILAVAAYTQPGPHGPEPLFVADFDGTRLEGYANRYFGFMFGLQRLFARTVETLEAEIFEKNVSKASVTPVSLDVFRATA